MPAIFSPHLFSLSAIFLNLTHKKTQQHFDIVIFLYLHYIHKMCLILTSDLLLSAYSQGLFPMAEDGEATDVQWVCPQMRGQISIERMHIPRRLQKNVKRMTLKGLPYDIRINTAFEDVITYCAQATVERKETWINDPIISAYCDLHRQGYAHCVECWQDNTLVGGLYGIAIGGAFFGESMFSRARDASKVALVHLAARLWYAGYKILDTQFTNDHLEQFGVYETPHHLYMEALQPVLELDCVFDFKNVPEGSLIKNYLENLS